MGFDLYGQGDNEQGQYFRNNLWYWHPLWRYICANCKDILTEEEMQGGSFNDGTKISSIKSMQIANRLAELLIDGKVSDYICKYKERDFRFKEDNVVDFMNFCGESGGFEIW